MSIYRRNFLIYQGRKYENVVSINTIRSKKRFYAWVKAVGKPEELEMIKTYYGYGNVEALSALKILTAEQINYIGLKLNKGGL